MKFTITGLAAAALLSATGMAMAVDQGAPAQRGGVPLTRSRRPCPGGDAGKSWHAAGDTGAIPIGGRDLAIPRHRIVRRAAASLWRRTEPWQFGLATAGNSALSLRVTGVA